MSAPAFEAVIGLEVHVQLRTRSKLFSAADAAFGAAPNHHTDPYTLALPGTLPVLNRAVVELALRMALATGCTVRPTSRFARKHYFYPDLPKGYQISQYDEPLAEGGTVDFLLDGAPQSTRLRRIHLEEDAGRLVHVAGASKSLVDLNRAGVPLIEVVSEPDLRSPRAAAEYLRALRQLVRYLGICDGNMEEGSLRCDANVSLRPVGSPTLGTRAELKNLNSFRHVQAAIEYEIARQGELLRRGERVRQETRLWDPERGTSHPMRSKEEAEDYRYFPEPDLPPLAIDRAELSAVAASLPEAPLPRRARFVAALGLSDYDAALLTGEREVADYFEAVVSHGADAKKTANWITGDLLRELHREGRPLESLGGDPPLVPAALAELLQLVDQGTISGKIAKEIFPRLWRTGRRPGELVEQEGLAQVSDGGAIAALCEEVVRAHPDQAAKYRAGAAQLLGFFVGQVMRRSRGKANPERVNQVLKQLLDGGAV